MCCRVITGNNRRKIGINSFTQLARLVFFCWAALAGTGPLVLGQDKPDDDRGHSGGIRGRVVETATGQIVPGAQVEAFNSSGGGHFGAVAGADGTYLIDPLPPGLYAVRALHQAKGVWSEGVEVRVVHEVTPAADVTLRQPQWISGVVREFGTGRPIPDVHINFTTANRNRDAIETDDQGRFRLDVSARAVEVVCYGAGHKYWSCDASGNYLPGEESRKLDVQAGQAVEGVEFLVRETPTVRGRVELPDGTPAVGAKVAIMVWWNRLRTEDLEKVTMTHSGTADFVRGPEQYGQMDGGGSYPRGNSAQGIVDESGWYLAHLGGSRGLRNPNIVPFITDAVAFTEDYALVGAAAEGQLSIRLGPPGSVRFRVVDENGQPRESEGIAINGDPADRRTLMGMTPVRLSPGEFRFEMLIPGLKYQLMVGRDSVYNRQQFEVVAGQVKDLGDLKPLKARTREDTFADLNSDDYFRFQQACWDLKEMGAAAEVAIPRLLAVLQDPAQMNRRGNAAMALGNMGPAAVAAVPALIEFANDPANPVKENALRPLAQIGDERALPAMEALLKSDHPQHPLAAAEALMQFPGDKGMPMVLGQLDPESRQFRRFCEAIGKMGPRGSEACDTLIRFVEADARNRVVLVQTLGRIGNPKALPVLEKLVAQPGVPTQEFQALAQAIQQLKRAAALRDQ